MLEEELTTMSTHWESLNGCTKVAECTVLLTPAMVNLYLIVNNKMRHNVLHSTIANVYVCEHIW